MRDIPILFSAPMVRGLIREAERPGTGKTQTRRLASSPLAKCQPGDRLYVRESVQIFAWEDIAGPGMADLIYLADADETCDWHRVRWTAKRRQKSICPAMHMPRSVSRLTLTATEVRTQCLQDIGEDDARAEGVEAIGVPSGIIDVHGNRVEQGSYVAAYAELWDRLHGFCVWDLGPEVVALTFTVSLSNIDARIAA